MPTYAEYTAAGGTMSEQDYTRTASSAWAYLDTLTLSKAAAATGSVRDKVRLCVFALANTLLREERGGEIVSASNDGYSESYAQSGKTTEQKLYNTAACYLAATGLLNRRMGGCARACMH